MYFCTNYLNNINNNIIFLSIPRFFNLKSNKTKTKQTIINKFYFTFRSMFSTQIQTHGVVLLICANFIVMETWFLWTVTLILLN